MGHKGKNKGKKKNAQNKAQTVYMTRTQAVKRLQLTLRDFRKLCILKGIFPRDPRKKSKLKGGDKTYYYAKDIAFLAHDPLIDVFRRYKAWRKKMVKARARNDENKVERLKATKPKYTLDHVVRERYPTFSDALRDVDDALCMLHLFTCFAQTSKIKPGRVANCNRLVKEFHSYIVASRSLRKVFVSIKGIYYQAEILGNTVTWLVPYQFTQKIPQDVDISVMLAFLEFYETLMSFVNFKLFHSLNLVYPPPIDPRKDANGEALESLILQSKDTTLTSGDIPKQLPSKETAARISSLKSKIAELGATNDDEGQEEEVKEEESNDQEMKEVFAIEGQDAEEYERMKEEEQFKNLFANCKFFLSREVPKSSLEFVIRCFGGEVSWAENPAFDESDETITHQIVDRPQQQHVYKGREYLQPQYVYDCINARCLLPTEDYLPNAKLPPHLSPFVDDAKEGYVPAQRERLNKMIAAARGITTEAEEQAIEEAEIDDNEVAFSDDEEEEAARLEQEHERELEAEEAGVSYSDFKEKQATPSTAASKKAKRQAEEEKEKRFSEIMIPSKKKRRLYQRIEYSENLKKEKADNLREKRQKYEEKQKQEDQQKQKQKKGAEPAKKKSKK